MLKNSQWQQRDLYSVITKNKNLYGKKLIEIPTPKFIIFYNGEEEFPDMTVLRLSDAFEVTTEDMSLELKEIMLNINPGHNKKLLETCKTLKDYSEYTHRIRQYAKTTTIEAAVDRAITECIREGILAEFLSKNRAEAKKVSIYEYDQEKHIRQEREQSWQEGHEAGEVVGEKKKLLEQIQKKLQKNKTVIEIANDLEESEDKIISLINELQKNN